MLVQSLKIQIQAVYELLTIINNVILLCTYSHKNPTLKIQMFLTSRKLVMIYFFSVPDECSALNCLPSELSQVVGNNASPKEVIGKDLED